MNESKSGMKIVFIIVLLLIVLPLLLLVLVQFAPAKVAPAPEGSAAAEAADARKTSAQERRARRENRAARQETTIVETAPDPVPVFEEVGAISPYATRGKQATPYPPDQVPGDSGVLVQYAGSPDDPMSGPVPPPPQDDLWGGQTLPSIPPENMRGIGGVRPIDPNDPFFQQDIPNPFNN